MTNLADELLEENRRIRAEGAQLRGQAISSQIQAGFTLCIAARHSFRMGDIVMAKKALDKLVQATNRIRQHLSEPRHVPADLHPALCADLKHLEEELQSTQAEIR